MKKEGLALVLSVLLASLSAGPAFGQAPAKPAPSAGDGQLRSELALMGRTLTVAHAPDLRADDPAHQALQTGSPAAADVRVRVARLTATGPVNVNTLEIGKPAGRPDPSGMRYDMWLQGRDDAWQLELTDVPKDSTVKAVVVGLVPLLRTAATTASPTFVAALMPETGDTGRLVLRWGKFEASANLTFPVQQNPPRAPDRPNQPTSRTHTEDLSLASRFLMLTQRNESAVVLDKGRRTSVAFQRTFGPGERATGGAGTRTSRGLPADGPDFARLPSTPSGSVVQLTRASIPRLRIEGPIRFGKTVVPIGNQVPGVAGLYGIWLKRAGKGWRLVFNNEPDVWGTQHDAVQDAAEVDLTHSEQGGPSRPFAVALVPLAAERGRLVILWGPHEWSTEFVAVN